jgi:hypothetical protein
MPDGWEPAATAGTTPQPVFQEGVWPISSYQMRARRIRNGEAARCGRILHTSSLSFGTIVRMYPRLWVWVLAGTGMG